MPSIQRSCFIFLQERSIGNCSFSNSAIFLHKTSPHLASTSVSSDPCFAFGHSSYTLHLAISVTSRSVTSRTPCQLPLVQAVVSVEQRASPCFSICVTCPHFVCVSSLEEARVSDTSPLTTPVKRRGRPPANGSECVTCPALCSLYLFLLQETSFTCDTQEAWQASYC